MAPILQVCSIVLRVVQESLRSNKGGSTLPLELAAMDRQTWPSQTT